MCVCVFVICLAQLVLFFPQKLHLVPIGIQLPTQGVVLLLQRRLRLIIYSCSRRRGEEMTKMKTLSVCCYDNTKTNAMFYFLKTFHSFFIKTFTYIILFIYVDIRVLYHFLLNASSYREFDPNRRLTSPSPPLV